MSDVINLFEPQLLTGPAICRACKHEFEATAEDTFGFACPNCNENKAVFKNFYGAADGEFEFICTNCDGHDFFIWKRNMEATGEIRCRGCGLEITGWF